MTRSRPASTESGRPAPAATYVYCVARSSGPPDLRRAPPGLPGTGKPRALAAGRSLWLVVADAPTTRYGEAPLARVVRDLDAMSRCALAHSAVVAHCARRHPILPLRLLTLFSSDARAVAQLSRRRAAIASRLGRVAGQAEWGVQVRPESGGGRSARRAEAAARRQTAALSPGARYLERRRRRQESTRAAAGEAREAAASLYRTLARHATAARRRPAVSVDGRPALLLDAAFLVPAARAARFQNAVRAQAARGVEHGLRIRLTGPWPPYSFVAGRL